MDKIQKYPQTVSSAVRVDSKGSTLELALAAINVALAGKATSQDLESLKADLLASIAEKATINDLVENEYTMASSLTEMSERIDSIVAPSASAPMKEITWSELKDLRDTGTLVAGMWYRITDYDCTTSTTGTTSAGNHFDVIVRADSTSVLNENAFACQSERDTDGYFANSDLNAWQLKYCLDNDTSRFAWADSTSGNGRGVIYWMRDEFFNEVPYDFKNIQYWRYTNGYSGMLSGINEYQAGGIACYTFNMDGLKTENSYDILDMKVPDTSVLAKTFNVYYNVIREYIVSGVQKLNNSCFFGNYIIDNTLGRDCFCNSFGSYGYYNSLGHNSFRNIIYGSNNHLGMYCNYNSILSNGYTTLGSGCSSNVIKGQCCKFGDNCYNNMIGEGSEYNTFGNYCSNNNIADHCYYNTFGINCNSNTFSSLYTKNNHLLNTVSGITLTTTATTSYSTSIQNLVITKAKASSTISVASDDLSSTKTIVYGSLEYRD